MTSSLDDEVRRRRVGAPARRGRPAQVRETIAGVFAREIRRHLDERHALRFPSPRYRADPVAFADHVLGVRPWSRAREILESVRDHLRVAVKSGHKVSKSHTAAIIALWLYCSWEGQRVIMSSTTARQVDEILWRELAIMKAKSGRCCACRIADPEGLRIPPPCPHSGVIEGTIGQLARTGLKSDDWREVVGFTAREAEAVAGISGANLGYVLDEASGIPPQIYEAIEGNRAGGARIVMFSNPTKTEGYFFDAFHSKAEFWHTITVSSEESPNVTGLEDPIPGLATPDWIEEKKREWGETSPMYLVRVKGEFPTREDGKIFSIALIALATSADRRREASADGRLWIGLDPAGPTGLGDEIAFAWRRSYRVQGLERARGLSIEGHMARLFGLVVAQRRADREVPVVVLDREGSIGAELYGRLSAVAVGAEDGVQRPGVPAFELVGLRASDRAIRHRGVYDRVRDELTANLEAYVRDGGSLPEDAKLERELHAVEWVRSPNGRVKVTPKDELRKTLGRSPDSFDAVTLCCWEPLSLREGPDELPASVQRLADAEDDASALDPYRGSEQWDRLGRDRDDE